MYVNTYKVGRDYGGPEEGGWWFDVWTPIASVPVDETHVHRDTWMHYTGITEEQYDEHINSPGGLDWHELSGGLDFAGCMQTARRTQAEAIAEQWRARYPYTGKRGSVIGGGDYDVRIEDRFAVAGDNYRPWE